MLGDYIALSSFALAIVNTGIVITIWRTTRKDLNQQNIEVIKAHLAVIDIALARIEERLKNIELNQKSI